MTKRRTPEVVDLPRVAAALARIEALAREHPELTGPSSPENVASWEASLAADDNGENNMAEPTTQCAFRLPDSLVERVDAYAETLSAPGMRASRADAVRVLLMKALDSLEEHGAASSKASKGTKAKPARKSKA